MTQKSFFTQGPPQTLSKTVSEGDDGGAGHGHGDDGGDGHGHTQYSHINPVFSRRMKWSSSQGNPASSDCSIINSDL